MSSTGVGTNPPYGIQPEVYDAKCTNRHSAALAKGDIVMLDLTQSDSGNVTNVLVGSQNSVFANVVAPATAFLQHGIYGVVLDDAIAEDAVGNIRFKGIVEDVTIVGTATLGLSLVPIDGELTLDTTSAAGEKKIGVALEAGTGDIKVWFNGIGGFGTQ